MRDENYTKCIAEITEDNLLAALKSIVDNKTPGNELEKVFDSLDHDFLLCVLEKFGFGDNFINWISILLNDQQCCAINRGFIKDGDPI